MHGCEGLRRGSNGISHRILRKRTKRLAMLSLAVTALGLAPAAARAQLSFLSSFGAEGAAQGDFAFPYGLAVGPTGLVYVADTDNDRVQVFSPTGTFLSSI